MKKKTKNPSPFTITETLYEGRGTIVLRGIRVADRRPVILKVLDPRRSRPQDIERLKHEYAIGQTLNLSTVVTPLALEMYEGMPALVLEDFGGASLDHFLGAPMAIERFLDLVVRIAAAVAELHQQAILHKDLKPQNILVNAATGQVKLADFGLASRLPREHKAAESPALIEGSLLYLSPEQTGRMNRVIDSRADLYALGVTFYEMLTGRLPFEAHDPLEWVHCHVARTPPRPGALVPELPEVLSAIVLKLLAKMAEDRYQTARGLQHDLERCVTAWRAKGRLEPFPLAEHDVSDRFQIPQKLYGREDEVALLLSAFERVVGTGSPELVLVSGYSGIGKSALVNELHKPAVRERGFFISGKFDQYKRDIPYSTIVQAFQELVLDILAESEPRIAAWRQRLLSALAINAQLIVEVIPQVELVIGRQPPAPELPPAEALNRFHIVFRHFIGVFAQNEHPLTLFLDDLQWADSASLGLLQDLMTHPETRHLLVVGAYRDNEVTPSHPLMLTLDKVRKEGARVSDIVLGPLSREHLATLLGATLHCRREEATPLARLVHEKTAGNPFFAIQFLTALHEEGLIEFDEGARVFRWDTTNIRAKNFADNVVDLMLGKLKRLPAATQEALKQLACLGTSVELAILTLAHGGSEQEVHTHLWEAVRAGLVLGLEGRYKFLHDRVQEAAYALIPEERRAEVHLGIGRLLVSRLPEEAITERVFDIANQLNHGAAIITDPREKEMLCRLNFQAGRKAKASIAYASAQSYLAQAAALLPPDGWSARYQDTFTLYLELSECEYLVGNFQRADALFDLILDHARSLLDCVKVYRLRMRLYQSAGRHRDAVTVMEEALRLYRVTLPESDEEIQVAAKAEMRQVPVNLGGRRIPDLVDAPMATDVTVRVIIGLLAEGAPPVYVSRPALWPLITAKGVNFSLQFGNTEESSLLYSSYAMMLVSCHESMQSALQFSEMALRLNEKLNNVALKGKVLSNHGAAINFWCRHFATGSPILEQAFLACLETGDLIFTGYLAYIKVWHLVENGDPLDHVITVSRRYAAFARQTHNDLVYHMVRIEEQFAASLKGATRASTSFDDNTFDEAECVATLEKAGFGLGAAFYHIMKQIAAFTHERYAEALESAASAALVLREVASLVNEATHHFYHALTLTALHAQAPTEQQQQFAQTLAEQLRKLKLWADNCPENFLNRYALVSAEVARIEGRELDAMRLYEEAIRSARDNGFVQNEALAYELASRFYRTRGFDQIADTYLRDARACYARWGADGKVEQIDHQNPRLVEPRTLTPTTTFAVRPAQFDLLSVTKASQTISGEIVLDKLLRTLLEVVLEQGSAQRACLILCQGDSLSIDAEAALEEKGTVTSILGTLPGDSSQRVPMSLVRYVQRIKERVILGDAAADAGKFSGDDYFARHDPKSVLCMPIVRQTKVVGLLYLENNLLADAFTPDRLVALSLLATQAAISLENALLLSREQAARAAAEEEKRRAAFLAEAGALLAESLDYNETLTRLGRLCVQSLCDWCVIDILEGEEIWRISAAHKDPAKEPLLEELQRRYPPRWDSPHPAAVVLRTGEPLLLHALSDEVIQQHIVDDEHARLIRELEAHTSMSVPLVARGHTLGVLSLTSSTPGRRYGGPDLELVQEVARRAAVAIDNARLYREAQETARIREDFVAIASHEPLTPLTPLKLQLQLVDSMLDVSRLAHGQLDLELEEADLSALVRETVDRFQEPLAKAGSRIKLRADPGVTGRWDRLRIEQVIVNLLGNAIKFGLSRPIDISVVADGGMAILSVQDHGLGIKPEDRERVFGRFERTASGKSFGGLGLGLYVARQIVTAHGGAIRLTSEPGAGSCFTVELPRSRQGP